MKVCIVTTAFPRWHGDNRAPFVYQAARALDQLNLDVTVVAMHNPGSKVWEGMDSLRVIRPRYLPERFESLQKDQAGIPSAWSRNPISGLFQLLPFIMVHTISCAIQGRKADIIHANWTLSALAAYLSTWIHRRPYIVTVQGSDIFQAVKIPLFKTITRIVLHKAKKVIALSHSLAEAVASLGIPQEHIQVIPNGVDTSQFQVGSDERQPIILYVGSLIERKSPKDLVKTMPYLLSLCPGYHLIFIGEGEQKSELLELAKELKLAGQVEFLGTQSQEQVSQWMRISRVFVLPSTEEGLGVVLLEALASGTPCVGTLAGGIPDVISSEVGKLVPPGNPQALAEAIYSIVQDNRVWKTFSMNARRRAEEVYDWQLIAKQIRAVYQEFV